MNAPMPALFVSHGAPTTALEQDGALARALRAFAARVPKPRAVVIVSAHWQDRGVQVGASPHPGLLYDFGGFADALYQIRYPCPGAPELARRIVSLVPGAKLNADRGLDHGAWTPLVLMLPLADIPVVQVSLPYGASRAELLALGRSLGPQRDEGVLLLGSGGAVHNLRRVDLSAEDAPVAPWAREFDEWLRTSLETLDVDLAKAPNGRMAQPTPEHFDPLYVVLGAARPGERAVPIYEGFQYGTLSMRSFAVE